MGAWTPVGAVQTGDGYEVAFSAPTGTPGQDQYLVWNVDSNGNYTSKATGILSGTAPSLQGWKPPSATGPSKAAPGRPRRCTQLAANSVTQLDELEVSGSGSQNGDAYELNPAGGTGGPLLELNGSVVTKGQFGAAGWTPVGAVQTANGYEVAFENSQNQYVVWNIDSNGDFTGDATGVLPGNSFELAGVEAAFGDGKFAGAGSKSRDADPDTDQRQKRRPAGCGWKPSNELETGDRCSSSMAAWSPKASSRRPAGTPVGAVQTATGYEVAFENGKNQFVVWNTDSNGNFTSDATGILSSTSYALEDLETTFGEDLNGDGTTGPTVTQIATNSVTQLDAVANQFQLNPSGQTTGPFLTLNGSPVTTTTFTAGWTPVGAVQTATGYEVAFGDGKGDFVVWNTDSNGNFTGNATPVVLSEQSDDRGGGSQLRRDLHGRRDEGDGDHACDQHHYDLG